MNRGRLRLAFALVAAVPSAGCVYLNGLYNAERSWRDAERARLAGHDSVANAAYRRAAEGAERSYARAPEGRWADDALYLLGRARLRQGEWAGARDALTQARDRADEEELRAAATLYLGALALATGDRTGVDLVEGALGRLGRGPARAEGLLWRARHLLGQGQADLGWADLERARLEDPSLRVPAALEWLASGVADGDRARAREGLDALLADPNGAERADTVAALATVEAERRGPAAGASLLAGADAAAWNAADRDRLLLLRAELHRRAGDAAAAREDGARVVRGGSARAVDARLWLADWALSEAERPDQLAAVRTVLVPAAADARAGARIEAARRIELLAERGPLGLFVAAEVARDALAAPRLAEALFVEYAALVPAEPWRGKALLAAAAVAPEPGRRDALVRAAGALPGDPYVAVAMGIAGDPDAYEILERVLRDEVAALLAEVDHAVRERDLLLVRTAAEGVLP